MNLIVATNLSVTVLVIAVEIVAVGWQRSSLRRFLFQADRSHVSDLLCFLVFGIGGAVTTWALLIGSFGTFYWLGYQVALATSRLASLRLSVDTGSDLGNFAIYCLVFSFIEYWFHRVCHTGAFWNLHRLHHAATAMNPLMQYRNHPGQYTLEVLFMAWPAGLISVPAGPMAVFGVMIALYQTLIHADVGWRWGWLGRWVIHSPAGHRLHHSADPAHYGKNLGVLVVWDRLFGTWCDPVAPVAAVGVDQAGHDQRGLLWHIVRDYGLFAWDLASAIWRARPRSGSMLRARR